jgi:hypothetical protein
VSELDDLKAFEAKLKDELARVPAPEGFADRVMARVVAQDHAAAMKRGKVLAFRGGVIARSRIWMTIAAAVLIAVATGSGVRVEQHLAQQAAEQRQERAKAELAQQQFALAMQVTSRTLVEVQERIGKAGAKQVRD